MINKELKILVVDDEPDVIEILTYNLRKEGFEVNSANSGTAAIQAATNYLPDLVILDIRMPGMTGIEVCRKMREIEKLKSIPVLFLTADSDEFTTMKAFEAGGNHFITKPVRPSVLMQLINELFK